VAPDTKFEPATVIVVPPVVGPEVGDTEVTVGAGFVYVNPFASVADWPSGFVTWTLRAPAVPAGVVPRTCVALTNVTPVASTPFTRIVAPDTKLVPVTVIVVPPVVGPDVGDTDVTAGAAFEYVNAFASVAD
jgi:hypothetical protein